MEDITLSGFGDILKAYRKQRKISQQELASRLDLHRNTIGGWERGDFLPESKTIVLELAKQLHLDENETRRLLEASLTAITPYWNVPYQRNPFFTGRDKLLHTLHEQLRTKQAVALCQSYALSGLGGIGKTQLALEYAYQYALDYCAIFWVAAETVDTLFSSFITIAELIKLPEREEKDYLKIVKAVLRWFTAHDEWLLIFDNVEDTSILKPFLPASRQGALLITTRLRALDGLALAFELLPFPIEEGIRFLLHRSRLIDSSQPLEDLSPDLMKTAQRLVEMMDGLPLALDQAGAYIEKTGCSLVDYIQLYLDYQVRLLDERSGAADHPYSVVKTFQLSFKQIIQTNIVAADLLRLCAFLSPEAIPEELIIKGTNCLDLQWQSIPSDPLILNEAIGVLCAYSLVNRDPKTKTLSIHRLVQVVLWNSMSEHERYEWIQQILIALNAIFPALEHSAWKYEVWHQCERSISHILYCAKLVEAQGQKNRSLGYLLFNAAGYLYERSQYVEAELCYQRVLSIWKELLGTEHPDIAYIFTGLANLYRDQGRYGEAEALYKQALHIGKVRGEQHLAVAKTLIGLGNLYRMQGNSTEAEALYHRTLKIRVAELGEKHLLVSDTLIGLANIYLEQGQYIKAEPLYKQALHICSQILEEDHPHIAYALNGLALIYKEQGKNTQAKVLFERALYIFKQVLGKEQPAVAAVLTGLADVYVAQGNFEDAKLFYMQALEIFEKIFGEQHPDMAYMFNGLANVYRELKEDEEAEKFFQRALSIRERHLGREHIKTAETLHDMAFFYSMQGRRTEAISLYKCALDVRERALGINHSKTIETRTLYSMLLQK